MLDSVSSRSFKFEQLHVILAPPIIFAALLAYLFVVFSLLVFPSFDSVALARKRLANARQESHKLQLLIAEYQQQEALIKQQRADLTANPSPMLERISGAGKEWDITLNQVELYKDDHVKLQIERVRYEQLIKLLLQLSQDHSLDVIDINIQRTTDLGYVSTTMTLIDTDTSSYQSGSLMRG